MTVFVTRHLIWKTAVWPPLVTYLRLLWSLRLSQVSHCRMWIVLLLLNHALSFVKSTLMQSLLVIVFVCPLLGLKRFPGNLDKNLRTASRSEPNVICELVQPPLRRRWLVSKFFEESLCSLSVWVVQWQAEGNTSRPQATAPCSWTNWNWSPNSICNDAQCQYLWNTILRMLRMLWRAKIHFVRDSYVVRLTLNLLKCLKEQQTQAHGKWHTKKTTSFAGSIKYAGGMARHGTGCVKIN